MQPQRTLPLTTTQQVMHRPPQRPGPKLPNIECIILAEFDIIEGSKIKYQHPRITGIEKQVLAEFMLPDGAHNRSDDWTAFFLWRPTVKGKFRDSKFFDETDEPVKKKFPVINTYVYKFESADQTSGWQIQTTSMAQIHLCSPIQVKVDGKPIHEIKHSEGLHFRELGDTFISVPYTFEIAFGYQFITKEDATKFKTFLEMVISGTVPESSQLYPTKPKTTNNSDRVPEEFLYCLSVLINKKDDNVTRGAIVKSLAVCSRYSFINIWRPFMLYCLEKYIRNPQFEILKDLYETINSTDISQITRITPNERLILRHSSQPKGVTLNLRLPEGRSLSLDAPLCFSNDEIGGEVSIKELYQKFGRQIIHIYNAIVLEKKVLFVGYNFASREVCKCVLASLLMCSPPIHNLMHRTFPYANLVLEEFHNLPGYIAGVTNPIFEQHTDWWDICCNLQTGKISFSSHLPSPFPASQSEQADSDFMDIVEFHIAHNTPEDAVRSLFTKYTQEIIDIAFNERVYIDDEEKVTLTKIHLPRCGLWASTPSYRACQEEIVLRPEKSAIKGVDHRHIRKLLVRKEIETKEIFHIFSVFEHNIQNDQQIVEFLTFFPENQGGLIPISLGLFHTSPEVREVTAKLLAKLDGNKFGHNALMTLGKFTQLALQKARQPPQQPYLPGTSQTRPSGRGMPFSGAVRGRPMNGNTPIGYMKR